MSADSVPAHTLAWADLLVELAGKGPGKRIVEERSDKIEHRVKRAHRHCTSASLARVQSSKLSASVTHGSHRRASEVQTLSRQIIAKHKSTTFTIPPNR